MGILGVLTAGFLAQSARADSYDSRVLVSKHPTVNIYLKKDGSVDTAHTQWDDGILSINSNLPAYGYQASNMGYLNGNWWFSSKLTGSLVSARS